MKNLKNSKGITLIALIITIVIMLILVAISIRASIQGGLFQKAGQATLDTKNKIAEEQNIATKVVAIDGENFTIDEYVNYMTQPKLELSYEIIPNTNTENAAIIELNLRRLVGMEYII